MKFTKFSFTITGSDNRPMTADMRYCQDQKKKPLLIFIHGFKGFKDWGHFPRVCDALAENGFLVVSFNFSHNGTTPEHPTDFADLEAFGNNNYSKELDDLGYVIDFMLSHPATTHELNPDQVYLLGHSRGGGIALLKAAEDKRIRKAVGWASIGDTEKRVTPVNLNEWKSKGVIYIENARTQQEMPLYYQFREDFLAHKSRLDLKTVAPALSIPVLLVQGDNDDAVSVEESENLHCLLKNSKWEIIENANHTFGGRHPWESKDLTDDTRAALKLTLAFLKAQ